MDTQERLELSLRGTEEVVTRPELSKLLSGEGTPRAYVGLEPSGPMHIGIGLIVSAKVADLVRAGFHTIIFLADWHAYINDKLGGDLAVIQGCGTYFKDAFQALGVPGAVEFRVANDFVAARDYWREVLRVSKASSLARIRRALPIMGRSEKDSESDASKLIYPAMQVADIHWMNLDLAYGGMDQRHAHMLYRDLAPKLGWKQVVALHTPLLPSLAGGSRMDPGESKMSKSKPAGTILIHDSPAEIRRKLGRAYCPPKEAQGNPVLEIARLILFPRRGALVIPRDPKYGGDVIYGTYTEAARAYVRGDLHPQDLKAGVADGLVRELEPARAYFGAHPDRLPDLGGAAGR